MISCLKKYNGNNNSNSLYYLIYKNYLHFCTIIEVYIIEIEKYIY